MVNTPKSGKDAGAAPTLADLRTEIDRIDRAMHELLIERSEIIGTLIAVKKSNETGSAFRPAREASMMRALVERHRGLLPLDTVESIWRVIIATFTYVQQPYSVHVDLASGDALVRDSVRFHFGYTVPVLQHVGASSVIDAVAASRGDLGLVRAEGVAGTSAWWRALEGEGKPKIIARLPFVERGDHPAALPLFVVSKPLAPEAALNEVEVWSVHVAGWSAAAARALSPLAEVIALPDGGHEGAALLVSVPQERKLEEILESLKAAGASVRSYALAGGHATRYTVSPR
ncbi:MAG: chorismate mutase [Xanthobacteraceae bacterium]|nr:chorismate mutase [Xanthobacteraceae bacterium]QYK44802.1 MAG: chorismate mutase [Xanthobacteraceae bacterium]HMN52046.1 chorismate mutase [Xanthobacteraceae bacterium]